MVSLTKQLIFYISIPHLFILVHCLNKYLVVVIQSNYHINIRHQCIVCDAYHIQCAALDGSTFVCQYFRRIYKILPQRIQQYQASSCVAEERNRAELEKIRQQQEDARRSLIDLDKRHNELDLTVNRAKQLKPAPDHEV